MDASKMNMKVVSISMLEIVPAKEESGSTKGASNASVTLEMMIVKKIISSKPLLFAKLKAFYLKELS